MPYLRKRKKSRGVRIEVMADSMRVGKTTGVKVIAEGLRTKGYQVSESYEDWQNNPYLSGSYADPAENFLNSQKWFIKRKWEQIRGATGEVFIQDVSPEMDYCYAETNRRLGRMSQELFDQYHEYFHNLDWGVVPAPDLLVYLTASDEVLLQRAIDSRREFETVEPEYYLMMKRVNREWLAGAKGNAEYYIVEVETDSLDFAKVAEAKGELTERIYRAIQSE